jgi:tetratricopeptide (TPR) repeat protein
MDDCSICLSALEAPTTLSCGHSFHAPCILESGMASPHPVPPCPLCREPVRECQQGLEALARYKTSGFLTGDRVLMEKAAAFGSARCAHELGNMYYDGIGVEMDRLRGENYWKQSTRCFASCSRLAYLETERNNAPQAIVYFKKAIEMNPSATLMVDLARLLAPTEESDELYMRALSLYYRQPECQAKIYFLVGNNLVKRQRHEEASAYYEQCLELKPDHARARMMAALTTYDAELAHWHADYLLAADANDVEAICLKARLHLEDDNVAEADRLRLLASSLAPHSAAAVRLEDNMRQFIGPVTRKRARECSGR